MSLNISFALAAVFLSFFAINNLLRMNKVHSPQNALFLYLAIDNGFTACSAVAEVLLRTYFPDKILFLSISSFVYFLTHLLIVPFLFLYICSHIMSWHSLHTAVKVAVVAPIGVALAALFSNPFTHVIFYYSEGGVYHRGYGIWIIYAIAAYYVVGIVIVLLLYRKRVPVRKINVVIFTLVFSLIAVVLQVFLPDSSIEVLAVAIAIVICFLFIQNPREQMDPDYPALSFQSMLETIHSEFIHGISFDVIYIIADDYTTFAGENIDREFVDEYLSFIGQFTNGGIPYRVREYEYALVLPQPGEEQSERIVKEIEARFKKPWMIFGKEVELGLRLIRVRVPEDVKDEQILIALFRQFSGEKDVEGVRTMADFDLEGIDRTIKISGALTRAMDKHGLEMRYSPVYSPAKSHIVGLQAAVRFFDEETGYVYDDEIFRFAERSGHIMQISEMIFDNTCRFISENKLDEKGISFAGIRMYPAMVLQYGIFDKLRESVKKYGVKTSDIYLMISESMLALSTAEFRKNMYDMEMEGVRFCLEEYGNGYTNLATIYELPIRALKINRSVMRASMDNEKAKVTVGATMDMAHDLALQTMVSGIDDKKYYEMIESLDVDYATGKYFYEQLDEETFMKVLEDESAGPSGKGAAK